MRTHRLPVISLLFLLPPLKYFKAPFIIHFEHMHAKHFICRGLLRRRDEKKQGKLWQLQLHQNYDHHVRDVAAQRQANDAGVFNKAFPICIAPCGNYRSRPQQKQRETSRTVRRGDCLTSFGAQPYQLLPISRLEQGRGKSHLSRIGIRDRSQRHPIRFFYHQRKTRTP